MTSPRDDASARLALVTGTSTGIGLALARILLQRGWAVTGAARRPAPIDHPRYRHLSLDLSDVVRAAASLEKDIGPLLSDPRRRRIGLVNNAASADLLTHFERIEAAPLLRVYAVNAVMPVWLTALVLRKRPPGAAVRIVNLSSAAAVTAFPGMAAYCSSKAALRMAGMVLGAELASGGRGDPAAEDVAVLSYEPGLVDTPMQEAARSQPPDSFPLARMFQDFAARGALVPPELPAAEIAAFLESERESGFTERRFGGS